MIMEKLEVIGNFNLIVPGKVTYLNISLVFLIMLSISAISIKNK